MRETKSARLTRMHDEYDILRQVIPAPACALHFSNPLELLIATVLSAQTTDKLSLIHISEPTRRS